MFYLKLYILRLVITYIFLRFILSLLNILTNEAYLLIFLTNNELRELSFVSKKIMELIKEKLSLRELLYFVMFANEKEVKNILLNKPGLLALSTFAIDPAGRVFDNVTALQYAVWAYDWQMWLLIIDYMEPKQIKIQLNLLLKEFSLSHGRFYNAINLLEKIQFLLSNYIHYSKDSLCEYYSIKIQPLYEALPCNLIQEMYRDDEYYSSPDRFLCKRATQFKRDIYFSHLWRYGQKSTCIDNNCNVKKIWVDESIPMKYFSKHTNYLVLERTSESDCFRTLLRNDYNYFYKFFILRQSQVKKLYSDYGIKIEFK